MADGLPTASRIVDAYRARTPASAKRYSEALTLLPSGVVHDGRRTLPYGIYVDRALGSRKWDIDGNEYVDYYGGHGALLLGHHNAAIVEAIKIQVEKGMHFAAATELEVEWARLVHELIPSAERVRFTSSGTEATHLAMRLARAATGKGKILRFQTHFHGWHDHVAFGVSSHLDGTPTSGVLADVASNVILMRPNDTDGVDRMLSTRKDVAAVILEPIGSSSGAVPTSPAVLRALREITRRSGVLLIFDEVVTAFRVAPGGVQALHDVIPDLTTMAKVLAGGMPGGAVGGRKDILDWLDYEACAATGHERISHQGTHNGNVVCAAAGITALKIIRDTDACKRASATAAQLRAGMNAVLEEEGVPWAVYGEHSFFHFFTNQENHALRPTQFDANRAPTDWFKTEKRERMMEKLRIAMLVNGVDLKGWRGGVVSAVHTPADVQFTLDAWRTSLQALKAEGDIARVRHNITAAGS